MSEAPSEQSTAPPWPWMAASCGVAAVAAWAVAWQQPSQALEWLSAWAWPLVVGLVWAVLTWLGGVSANPDQVRHRRWQVLSAIVLALSLMLATELAGWRLQPDAPWSLLQRADLHLDRGAVPWALSLAASWSLVLLWRHPMMPALLSWPSALSAALCLTVLLLLTGRWLDHTWVASVPSLVLIVLLVVLTWRSRGSALYAAVPLWLACAAVLLFRAADAWLPPSLPVGRLLLTALLMGLPTWCAWWWRMDAIARFDRIEEAAKALEKAQAEAAAAAPSTAEPTEYVSSFSLQDHLDSAQAQEGADKYTRE